MKLFDSSDDVPRAQTPPANLTNGFPLDAAVGILHPEERVEWVFEIGVAVPTPRRRVPYFTTSDLTAGSSHEALRIPVVRGSGRVRHSVIGAAVIAAEQVSADVPAGSKVVLGIKLDAAHGLLVSAYLPATGDVFDEVLRLGYSEAFADDSTAVGDPPLVDDAEPIADAADEEEFPEAPPEEDEAEAEEDEAEAEEDEAEAEEDEAEPEQDDEDADEAFVWTPLADDLTTAERVDAVTEDVVPDAPPEEAEAEVDEADTEAVHAEAEAEEDDEDADEAFVWTPLADDLRTAEPVDAVDEEAVPVRRRINPWHSGTSKAAQASTSIDAVFFDWGNTLMVDDGSQGGPMVGWLTVQAVDGAPDVLSSLAPHYLLFVVTNADHSRERDVRAALARVGLDEFVHGIVTSRDVGTRKPDAIFYRAALLRAGRAGLPLAPGRAVMVGDSWPDDVAGARVAHLRTVWFNPSKKRRPKDAAAPDAEIRKLADLPEALAKL